MNQKYFDICNKTVYDIMGEASQGEIEKANFALSKLLVENTDLKMYLVSTGNYKSYAAWIQKFKKKNPGIEKAISQNLELEED